MDDLLGSQSMAAQMAAMQKMDQASAMTTLMNAEFQTQKMITDTVSAITNGQVDSANKAINAAVQSGKSIQY